MNRINWSWWLPYATGGAVAAAILLLTMSYNAGKLIEACKSETGSYECVIKAVPQAQPSWMLNNGETK